MKHIKNIIASLGVMLIMVATATAQYIKDFDPISILPPPPTQLSQQEQRADLITTKVALVLATTNAEAIHHEEDLTFDTYSDITGVTMSDRTPELKKLFTNVEKETKGATSTVKKFWKRERPYIADSSIIPVVKETTLSYPSGHSSRGVVYAGVLAELFPEKRAQLMEFGYNVGWHRVTAGVHYYSDIYAGRVLGIAILHKLLESPEFRQDLDKVRLEIANSKSQPVK